MDFKLEIYKLELKVEHLEKLIHEEHELTLVACEQINAVHARIDELEKVVKKNMGYASNEVRKINDILDIIGDKLYPVFYKIFPGAADAEDALRRAVKNAGKDPKSST